MSGVNQGCVLSPILLLVVMVNTPGNRLGLHLDFMDDTTYVMSVATRNHIRKDPSDRTSKRTGL